MPSSIPTTNTTTTASNDAKNGGGSMNNNNNNNNSSSSSSKYEPPEDFTASVIAATGPKAHPRLAEIMPSLLRHLHDFAREVDLTVGEWAAAVDFLNEAGQMSDDKRNETGLVCDVLGLESLVDEITSNQLLHGKVKKGLAPSSSGGDHVAASLPTPSAVLGPFYRDNAPILENGSSIVNFDPSSASYAAAEPLLALVHGRVLSATTGEAIPGAIVDVWHSGPDGLYEQQDAASPDMNLRGRFATSTAGEYAMYCLRPTAYPIPDDGPAGKLLQLLDRHPYRPAHIHFIVSAPGHRTLTTQIFDDEGDYIKDDAVFAVKKELLVSFQRREGDAKAHWELKYDITLAGI